MLALNQDTNINRASAHNQRMKMKKLLTIAVLLAGVSAVAQDPVYIVNGKVVTKVEALRALINDKNTKVEQCKQVELTDKATMRSK